MSLTDPTVISPYIVFNNDLILLNIVLLEVPQSLTKHVQKETQTPVMNSTQIPAVISLMFLIMM